MDESISRKRVFFLSLFSEKMQVLRYLFSQDTESLVVILSNGTSSKFEAISKRMMNHNTAILPLNCGFCFTTTQKGGSSGCW